MATKITVNIGFITNSSSCVYYFPKEILEDPQVKAFLEATDLGKGYVGSNMWHRQACSSFLVTSLQKSEAKAQLTAEDYGTSTANHINPNDDGVYVIYGDEYNDTTHVMCRMMSEAYARMSGTKDNFHAGYITDFN